MEWALNYYPHHLGDYDSHTAHLSWLEDCAYRRLICLYYRIERALPADIAQCCRLVRAISKAERDAVSEVLKEFFELRDDGWHNERCNREIAKAQAKAERNREVGKMGGRPPGSGTQPRLGENPDGFRRKPRPNPTQQPTANIQPEADASGVTTRKRAPPKTRRPDDFTLTQELLDIARQEGRTDEDARTDFDDFTSYCDANGRVYADWNAAWRNWEKRAAHGFGLSCQSAPGRNGSANYSRLGAAQRAAARFAHAENFPERRADVQPRGTGYRDVSARQA
jgi:hypothetical protein